MTSVHEARKALYLEGYSKIERILQRCIEADELPRNLHPRQAAIILRAYITGLMENWLFVPESFDLEGQAAQLIDTYIEMLRFCPSLLLPKSET